MRLNAYSELGWEKVPVCILPEDMPTKKLREIVIQDNNSFGETDWDMIANEWDMEELDDWGFDVWQEPKKKSKDPKKDEEEEDENADYYAMMLGDRIYDSNNEFDIPNLKIDGQPKTVFFCLSLDGEVIKERRKAYPPIIFMWKIIGLKRYGRILTRY